MPAIKAKQLEIITAAGEILSESGISGLTTKNLAAKMGFAESALYRHFKNKEAIIISMLSYLAEDMGQRFDACIIVGESPEQQLKKIINNQFDFFKKNPHFLIATFSDGLLEETPGINKAINDIMAVMKKYLIQVIKRGQDSGDFTTKLSVHEIVHMIMGSMRLHILQWRISGYAFDIKSKGNKLMDSLISLIKTQ